MTSTVEPENKIDDGFVTITIDGKEIKAEKDELLITAAQRAGIFIPRFCYHDRLKPVGMCRMCLVEIEGVRGLPPACTTPVSDGMVVRFKQNNVEKAQDGVLEFLLINHPLDCPVCDRGGECPLQDQTLSFGPGESRFVEEKRHWEKPIEISDHVLLDRERCIQCSRCTRFADDVAGDPLITFVERGGHTEVNTFPGDEFASHFSGNIVQICPVGALTAKPYRFSSRPWDIASAETTCTRCSMGCKGVAQTSRNEMVRFLGVDSEPINQGWLCDKGRYGFDYIDSENRIRYPYINEYGEKKQLNISSAIDQATEIIKNSIEQYGPDSVAVLGGAHGTNEDAYAISKLAKESIGTKYVDSYVRNSLPADLILSSKRARIADLDKAKAIVVIGNDVKETIPVLYLRVRNAVVNNKVPLIDVNSFKTSTTQLASDVINLVPGDETSVLNEIRNALSSKESDGKIVVLAGEINQAQDSQTFVDLISELLDDENVYLLPTLSTSNIFGAIEMGLTPGLNPGRVAQKNIDQAASCGIDSIIEEINNGKIKVLLTFGSNPVADYRDKELVKNAIEKCENIICVDIFENETTANANIFIPATAANEKQGTVTNIESRVQRVVQVVAPQGNVLDDWKIATLISENLGFESNIENSDDITDEIARYASSFAHLTNNVLIRSKDGAIVPVDLNSDSLVGSTPGLVQTPSWEPIESKAQVDEDPLTELQREEHHPSSNIKYSEMISAPFIREKGHTHHLDQYGFRLVFVDTFHDVSTITSNSENISDVASSRSSFAVRMNPRDLEGISIKEDNSVRFVNNNGSITMRIIPDKTVTRGIALTANNVNNPLNALVKIDDAVTDIKVEGKDQ
ncbi:MAG: NADH-quinone oxidoreductase subunit NuoG [Acidimicrobiia bacterium]